MQRGDLVKPRNPGPFAAPIGIVVSRIGTSSFVKVKWADPNTSFRESLPESFLEVVNAAR